MHRLRLLALLFCVAFLALSVGVLYAQTDEPSEAGTEEPPTPDAPTAEPADELPPAEYIGSRRCFSCHRDVGQPHFSSSHALTFQEADEDVIVADFEQGEDVRTVQLPGEDAPRAFTLDDIAFVIGTGTYAQQYVVAEEGDDATQYWVLPAGWDAVQGTWTRWGPDEDWPADAYDFTQNCAGCHTTGLDLDTGEWLDAGVQCEACHGPGSNHFAAVQEFGNTDDPAELQQIRGAIVLSPDSQICGACHSQGESPDGHPYPTNYVPGENLLADDVFELVDTGDDAHWWATGHASQKYMQFNEWLNSGHPRSLRVMSAGDNVTDACLTCHSVESAWTQRIIDQTESGERPGTPPEPASLETAQFGVTCVSCHTIHLPQPEEGEEAEPNPFMLNMAAYEQCTACHSDTDITGSIHHPVKEMFEGADVVDEVDGIPSAHFTDPNGPTCTTCHMPRVPVEEMGSRASHVFTIVEPGAALDVEGLTDTCSACHSAQASPASLQDLIGAIQDDTEARVDAARDAAGDGAPEWITQALDFIEGDRSRGIHNYAYTDSLLDAVEQALGLTAQPTLEVTAPPENQAQPTPTFPVVTEEPGE